VSDYKQQISDKKVRARGGDPGGFRGDAEEPGRPTVTIYNYEGEMKSRPGRRVRSSASFASCAPKTVERAPHGPRPAGGVVKPFEVKRQNVAPPEKVGGNLIGGLIPYIIIILCFTGAMYPAMDLTAGEKERGTMETLLCSPVHRVNIVLGKFLMVLTASIATMCCRWSRWA
jgi:sodium transport system permease protein